MAQITGYRLSTWWILQITDYRLLFSASEGKVENCHELQITAFGFRTRAREGERVGRFRVIEICITGEWQETASLVVDRLPAPGRDAESCERAGAPNADSDTAEDRSSLSPSAPPSRVKA